MTYNKVMRGATTARRAMSNFLSKEMPQLLRVARKQWDLLEWQLPDPVVWDAYDPLTARDYPTVGSLIQRDGNWRRMDTNEAGEDVFRSQYGMQVFIWCMTPTLPDGTVPEHPKELAMMLRDDEFGIMRACILNTPSLGTGRAVRVNVETITSDYLEPFQISDQNPLWLAGATMTFDIEMTEANYLPILGIAETFIPIATKIDEE